MLQKQSTTKLKRITDRSLNIFLSFILLIGIVKYIQTSMLTEVGNEVFEIVYVQENSLVAISESHYVSPQEEERDKAIELLLAEIIRRESGGNPNICNVDSCKYGRGHYQIVSGTEKTCEKELGKEINPFDPIEAKECALWLLNTNGIWDWEPWSGPYTNVLLALGLYEEMYLR